MSIDPRLVFWFGVWTSVLLGLATGAVHLPNTFSKEMAEAITSWAAFLGWMNTIFLTAASGYSSPRPGPLVGPPPSTTTVVKVLLVAFALSFLVAVNPTGA
jgi:hypothetical protein